MQAPQFDKIGFSNEKYLKSTLVKWRIEFFISRIYHQDIILSKNTFFFILSREPSWFESSPKCVFQKDPIQTCSEHSHKILI